MEEPAANVLPSTNWKEKMENLLEGLTELQREENELNFHFFTLRFNKAEMKTKEKISQVLFHVDARLDLLAETTFVSMFWPSLTNWMDCS